MEDHNNSPFIPPPLPGGSEKEHSNHPANDTFLPPPLPSENNGSRPPAASKSSVPEQHDSERKKHSHKKSPAQIKKRLFVIIVVCCIVGCSIFACYRIDNHLKTSKEQSEKYDAAVQLMESNDYLNAYNAFKSLGEYKDSASKLEEVQKRSLINASIGSTVLFGSYEQDGNQSNGKEVLEWMVLDLRNGQALLISKYCLSCQEFGSSNWESSPLRGWLNGTFMDDSFSESEQSKIIPTQVKNDTGNDTQDNIFLLSIDEMNQYFSDESYFYLEHQATATDAALSEQDQLEEAQLSKGYTPIYADNSRGGWWLRSPGFDERIAYACPDGSVNTFGTFDSQYMMVRPSMRIQCYTAGSETTSQEPLNINTALLADIGRTYKEMKEQYGDVVLSDSYEGGQWFEFEDAPNVVYYFVFNDVRYEKNPDDNAECYEFMTSANILFPNLESVIPADVFKQDLLNLGLEFDGADTYLSYLSFVWSGDIFVDISQADPAFVKESDSVSVLGSHVGGPFLAAP